MKRRALLKAAATAAAFAGLARFALAATTRRKMKIGIVGSGMVGGTLGSVWVRYLMPGTPLAGEHAPAEIRRISATLK